MPIYLSIVVPLFNEEESVEKLVDRITEVGQQFNFEYEILLVDDGSSDRTWSIIESLKTTIPQLQGVKFRRNFGQTAAMVAGIDKARGEIIVTLDGDLQNDPMDIPRLLAKIEQGYDIVSGWRKNRQDHFTRVLPSQVANYVISVTTGIRLHDYGCSLKAYRADCIRSIQAYGEMHRFFPALASMTGARVTEIGVGHFPRRYGASKYGFDRIFKVFSDIFSMNMIIRFSSKPLRGFFLCSLPFGLLTLLFTVLAVAAWWLDWTTGKSLFFLMAAALSSMSALHLNILGILGELVVNLSDLSHTRMPELTQRQISLECGNCDPPASKDPEP